VQRVRKAEVYIKGRRISGIARGLLVLIGISRKDTKKEADFLAGKTAMLRIFDDNTGRMNLSAQDTGAEILAVSQFTLYGDCTRGSRPSYTQTARAETAEPLYNYFIDRLNGYNLSVESGRFGADMVIHLENDGPVTLILEK